MPNDKDLPETLGWYDDKRDEVLCISCAARSTIVTGGSVLLFYPILEDERHIYDVVCIRCKKLVLKGTGERRGRH